MHVPYRGGGPALNDLVGGHVDIYVSSLPQVLQLAQSGRAKALAVTSTRRTALLPEVPTLEEQGVPGFDLGSWWEHVPARPGCPRISSMRSTQKLLRC